jgi:hypothetical protein
VARGITCRAAGGVGRSACAAPRAATLLRRAPPPRPAYAKAPGPGRGRGKPAGAASRAVPVRIGFQSLRAVALGTVRADKEAVCALRRLSGRGTFRAASEHSAERWCTHLVDSRTAAAVVPCHGTSIPLKDHTCASAWSGAKGCWVQQALCTVTLPGLGAPCALVPDVLHADMTPFPRWAGSNHLPLQGKRQEEETDESGSREAGRSCHKSSFAAIKARDHTADHTVQAISTCERSREPTSQVRHRPSTLHLRRCCTVACSLCWMRRRSGDLEARRTHPLGLACLSAATHAGCAAQHGAHIHACGGMPGFRLPAACVRSRSAGAVAVCRVHLLWVMCASHSKCRGRACLPEHLTAARSSTCRCAPFPTASTARPASAHQQREHSCERHCVRAARNLTLPPLPYDYSALEPVRGLNFVETVESNGVSVFSSA